MIHDLCLWVFGVSCFGVGRGHICCGIRRRCQGSNPEQEQVPHALDGPSLTAPCQISQPAATKAAVSATAAGWGPRDRALAARRGPRRPVTATWAPSRRGPGAWGSTPSAGARAGRGRGRGLAGLARDVQAMSAGRGRARRAGPGGRGRAGGQADGASRDARTSRRPPRGGHRNPDNDTGPWCFTWRGGHISWEYCAVPRCAPRPKLWTPPKGRAPLGPLPSARPLSPGASPSPSPSPRPAPGIYIYMT